MAIDDPQPRDVPSLWHNRDYMSWWSANTVSVLGTSISSLAFPLLILFTGRSAALAGLIMAAGMIGTLATTLLGGALADRVSRKALLICGPLVQAAALGAVAAVVARGHAPVPLLAGASLISGMAAGITAGATNPALRRIVDKAQLPAATSQEMGRDAAAELIGSPLSGILFSLGQAIPFVADAVSFLFAALGGALIRRPLGPDRREAPRSVLADIGDGLALVRRTPFLRFVVIWGSLLNVIAQGFVLLFIALVREHGGSPTEVGLVSSTALIGGVAGAIIAPLAVRRIRPRQVIWIAAWAFVAALGGVALVPRPWEIGAVLLVAMLALVPLNAVLESYVVRLVPDAYSGRVSAVTRFGGQCLQWTGPLLAGLLAGAIGASRATLVFMALAVPLALVLHRTRALSVLDQPADRVAEIDLTPPAPAPAAPAPAAPAPPAPAQAAPAQDAAPVA